MSLNWWQRPARLHQEHQSAFARSNCDKWRVKRKSCKWFCNKTKGSLFAAAWLAKSFTSCAFILCLLRCLGYCHVKVLSSNVKTHKWTWSNCIGMSQTSNIPDPGQQETPICICLLYIRLVTKKCHKNAKSALIISCQNGGSSLT